MLSEAEREGYWDCFFPEAFLITISLQESEDDANKKPWLPLRSSVSSAVKK
jgi:hypothetical protein